MVACAAPAVVINAAAINRAGLVVIAVSRARTLFALYASPDFVITFKYDGKAPVKFEFVSNHFGVRPMVIDSTTAGSANVGPIK
jgi:hypothetical protein